MTGSVQNGVEHITIFSSNFSYGIDVLFEVEFRPTGETEVFYVIPVYRVVINLQ